MNYVIPYEQALKENPEAVTALVEKYQHDGEDVSAWKWRYVGESRQSVPQDIPDMFVLKGDTPAAEETELLRQVEKMLEGSRYYLYVDQYWREEVPAETFREIFTEQQRLLRSSCVFDACLAARDAGAVAILKATRGTTPDNAWFAFVALSEKLHPPTEPYGRPGTRPGDKPNPPGTKDKHNV
jgi:hypothetical protein